MPEVFQAKLRKIGSSVGILVPQDRLKDLNVRVGDEIDVALLRHRTQEEMDALFEAAFGIAKGAGPFVRDKKTREF